MSDNDIIQAKEEAMRFVQVVNDWQKAEKKRARSGFIYSVPVEIGLIRAQSLILSRALSTMRNTHCKRNERKRK